MQLTTPANNLRLLSPAVSRVQVTDDSSEPASRGVLVLNKSAMVELANQSGKQHQQEPHRRGEEN